MVVANIEPLFDISADPIAAAPGLFPADQFNSGVMVIRPSKRLFKHMISQFQALRSYDCGDQGFLNRYFRDWFTGNSSNRLDVSEFQQYILPLSSLLMGNPYCAAKL
jgi:hypothetical protein